MRAMEQMVTKRPRRKTRMTPIFVFQFVSSFNLQSRVSHNSRG